jgi:uncharacterized protein
MKVTYKIDEVDFEWDSEKAEKNVKKHDVTFYQASEVFLDPFACPTESREVDEEAREGIIGLTKKWKLLYVAYAWRDLIIRIVSAREATKPQRKEYESQ